MMPIRWSSMAAANNPSTAFLSTIAKKTSSREVAAILPKHQQATKLLINNAAASRMMSNSPKIASWAPHSNATTLLRARQQQVLASSQKRFQSTSPKNNSNNNNTFTTLSTLAHFLTAGTGTFASTVLALYLATVVETSAHEFLFDHFPHWYDEVPLEKLPTCLKNRVVERSLVKLNSREKGLGEVDFEEGNVVDDFGLMGMDGWMEQQGQSSSTSLLNNELLAELEFEKRQETSAWQRKMTEKRADIIQQEEQDFSHGFLPASDSFSSSAKNGLVETKRIHEEATRKLQERLMSAAMTA